MSKDDSYSRIWVESFRVASTAGRHGPVHFRPLPDQGLPDGLFVECGKDLLRHPIGTKLLLKAKLTDREGTPFLYSSWRWAPYEIIEP